MKFRKYFVLFGGFLVLLTLGEFYSFGNVQFNVIKYMQNYSFSGQEVNFGNTVWIGSLIVFGHGASFCAGGFLEKKIGPMYTILIGGWLMSLNAALTFFTIKSYLLIVILSLGLLSGFGIGLANGSAIAVPLSFFSTNDGFIIGVLVSGFSLSSLLFGNIQNSMIEYLPFGNENLPISFLILGAIYVIMTLIGSILLKEYSKAEENVPSLNSNENCPNYVEFPCAIEKSLFVQKTDLEPHQILQEFDFWILWIMFLMNSYCVFSFTQLNKLFRQTFKVSLDNCIIETILPGISQFVGRIFWGYLIDRKPHKTVIRTITILTSIFLGTFNAIPCIYDKISRTYVYGLWISVINFLLSSNPSIFPVICASRFGKRNFICNYGLLFTACTVSGTIVGIIVSLCADQTNNKKLFNGIFYGGTVASLIAAALTFMFRGKSVTIYNY